VHGGPCIVCISIATCSHTVATIIAKPTKTKKVSIFFFPQIVLLFFSFLSCERPDLCFAQQKKILMERKKRTHKDLPSFHATQYSTYDRTRRQQRSNTPMRYRDKFMRFVEYPNGVYINHSGAIEAMKPGEHKKLFAECSSSSSDSDDTNAQDQDDDVVEIPAFRSVTKKQKPKVVDDKCLCVVCLENPAVGVFLACGHQCCCIKCGSQLEQCPICRAKSSFIHHLDVPLNITIFK
jgi:hypothetical protein